MMRQRLYGLLLCLFSSFLGFSTTALAASLQDGANWLAAQQGSSGSFQSQLATPLQASAEARRALLSVGGHDLTVQRAADYLQSINPSFTESAVRVSGASGAQQSLLAWSDRQAPAGWGDYPGYPASALATSSVLEVLAEAGTAGAPVDAGVAFLLAAQLPNGSWPQSDGESAMLATARALEALRFYPFSHAVSPALRAGADYLVGALQLQGDEVELFELALVLRALAPQLTDPTPILHSVERLSEAQGLDGSWQQDPFTTAVALQALSAMADLGGDEGTPQSALYGQLVHAVTGQPLAGLAVRLSGGDLPLVQRSDASGHVFYGSLVPGSYQLTVLDSGWEVMPISLSVAGLEYRSFGRWQIMPSASGYHVAGRVTDAQTDQQVVGARLAFAGPVPRLATSDTAGDFSILLDQAPDALTVTQTGYTDAVLALAGFQSGDYLPIAMQPLALPPVNGGLYGVVHDAETGAVIAGAQVTSSTGEAVSDGSGSFTLPLPGAQRLLLSVTAEGYRPLQLPVFSGGRSVINVGDIYLSPLDPQTTVLAGVVVDASTGGPIYGARLEAAGAVVPSGFSDGAFAITVPAQTALPMAVSAPGYLPVTLTVDSLNAGPNGVRIPLAPTGRGDVSVADISVDRSAYSAYELVLGQALISNDGSSDTRVLLFAKVYNDTDELVDSFPVVIDLASGSAAVQLAPGETLSLPLRWFTRNLPPGQYQLALDIYEERGWEIWATRRTGLDVQPTARVDNARLYVSPDATFTRPAADLELRLNARNRSNVTFSGNVEFELTSPAGATVWEGNVPVSLVPEQSATSAIIATETLPLDEEGRYQLSGSSAAISPLAAGVLDVMPNVRVDVDVHLAPDEVAADGDKVINATLEINGREAQP